MGFSSEPREEFIFDRRREMDDHILQRSMEEKARVNPHPQGNLDKRERFKYLLSIYKPLQAREDRVIPAGWPIN